MAHDGCRGKAVTGAAAVWYGMNWCRQEKRLALYLRDGFRCLACNRNLRNAAPGQVGLDHLLPRSKGGCNCSTNLVTICKPCNDSRGAKRWTSFYSKTAQLRVRRNVRLSLNLAMAKGILAGTVKLPNER